MGQTWIDLLFAHWPVEPSKLQPLLPAPLRLDIFEGRAWISVTPFLLTGLRLAATPPLPKYSTFPELNVRTYASLDEKPGIYFFSLDAGSRLAVEGARRIYRLPYFLAQMSPRCQAGALVYESKRIDPRGDDALFKGSYAPVGPPFTAKPGTVEHFLVERYCLYTGDENGELLRAEIHHPPWALQAAEASITINTMAPRGVDLPAAPPLLHFARRQDVLIWRPRIVQAATPTA
jgi:uncharacterized protein